ncbi:MAG: recombination-associated protein RdgC [Ottowia sp.]|nr:recombination-associated protein RdgC [Ottowia sp.]
MFKNLTCYRLGDWPKSATELEAALQSEPFAPCSATQAKSVGWAPPRGVEHGALVEAVDGQWVAQLVIETKAVPADAIRRRVDEEAARIEKESGRSVGRKERRDMKDDALIALLPQAFPRRTTVTVWVDPKRRLLLLDTASAPRADEATSALARASGDGWGVAPILTRTEPRIAMGAWLADEDALPAGFAIGMECELKGSGDEPASVRFARHPLHADDMRQHIDAGKLPVSLALGWQERVSFTLTQQLQLKKIRFDEGVMQDAGDVETTDARFDADISIATGELSALLDALLEALGGEMPEA